MKKTDSSATLRGLVSTRTGIEDRIMLDRDALAQLQGLKNKIEAEKEYAEGTVKGTRSRFGFVVLDDRREIFLPPDDMQRVLPGDRVAICIKPAAAKTNEKKTDKPQLVAELERLVVSPHKRFVGQVVNKGKAVFVSPDIPDQPNLTRWLFIPPKSLNGAEAGDFIHAELVRHPFKDGKPAVKVLRVLGPASAPGIENEYCAARAGINAALTADTEARIEKAAASDDVNDGLKRDDLSTLPFVTIDSPGTVDIDDALTVSPTDNGWDLKVAIADPTALLGSDSDITQALASRGTSHYFHGLAIPMIPYAPLQHQASLVADESRSAVICALEVDRQGVISSAVVSLATVRVAARLSYQEAEDILEENDVSHAQSAQIAMLDECASALRQQRVDNQLVMEARTEYRWLLDVNKQIQAIEAREKLRSQLLVEECMVAANTAIANFLASNDRPGPFIAHAGFRADRLAEAREFLNRYAPDLAELPLQELEGFQSVISGLSSSDNPLPLRSMVNRFLSRAAFSVKPAPHMGMSLPLYTTATSPLRRVLDYCVHLQIKVALGSETVKPASANVFDLINQAMAKNRQATMAAQHWLTRNYLDRLQTEAGQAFEAEIIHISPSGFTVKLLDTGLEGQVDLRKESEKFSFDKWKMALKSKSREFVLRDRIWVEYQSDDAPKLQPPAFVVKPVADTVA